MKDICRNDSRTNIIHSLPEDIHLLLLSYLPLKDLVNFRAVSSYFKSLIDNNDTLWENARLNALWPTKKNILHMERASMKGNIEASVKLGVTYLYNDTMPQHYSRSCNRTAARNFMRAESAASYGVPPFTWLFYRPPWITAARCRKLRVYIALGYKVDSPGPMNIRHLQYCYAQLLEHTNNPLDTERSLTYFRNAERLGCPHSALKFLKAEYSSDLHDIAFLRKLRDLVSAHPQCLEAHIELCGAYMQGYTAGLNLNSTGAFTQKVFQSSKPVIRSNFPYERNFSCVTVLIPNVKFILMDWLAEVVCEKEYGNFILHVTAQMIDRYVRAEKVNSADIQLLGITSLVLAMRCLHGDFLTIKEAAWVTDNTYKYDEVVKMMGNVAAVLKGRITVMTCYDYMNLLLKAAPLSSVEVALCEYYCMASLLHTEFTYISSSMTAAAAFVFAKIANKQTADVWPENLRHLTGFDLQDLIYPTLLLFVKCYIFRNESTVHTMYNTRDKHFVSCIKAPSLSKMMVAFCFVSRPQFYEKLAAVIRQVIQLNFQCSSGMLCSMWDVIVKRISRTNYKLIHFLLGDCSKSLRARGKVVKKKCKVPLNLVNCINFDWLLCKPDSRCPPSPKKHVKAGSSVRNSTQSNGGICNIGSAQDAMPLGERNGTQPERVGWKRIRKNAIDNGEAKCQKLDDS